MQAQVAPPKVLFFLFLANSYSSFFCFFTFAPLCFYWEVGISMRKIRRFLHTKGFWEHFLWFWFEGCDFLGFWGSNFNIRGIKTGQKPVFRSTKIVCIKQECNALRKRDFFAQKHCRRQTRKHAYKGRHGFLCTHSPASSFLPLIFMTQNGTCRMFLTAF